MSFLTESRNTQRREGRLVNDIVAAGTTIFAGSMYALNVDGHAVPAGAAGAGNVRAVARDEVRNPGAGTEIRVEGERSVFLFAPGDAITRADIGKVCYAVDDQTVSKANSGTQGVAGTIFDITDDASGVWVEIGSHSITTGA